MAVALETLLDVETEIESVFSTYLTTALPGTSVITSDSNTTVGTPRVEVTAVVENQPTHQYTITGGVYAGRRLYDFWRVRVTLNLVYAPGYSQSQGTLRGKLRKVLTDFAGVKSALAAHNYLYLASDTYNVNSGWRTVDSDLKEERIACTVDAIFGLNPAQLESAT